jgi:hypothetical protein
MIPSRRSASPAALPLQILPIGLGLAVLMTVAPFPSAAAHAQTVRDAGKAAAQEQSCRAQALERLKECEAEEESEKEEEKDEKAGGTPDRSGLGWTGIGLMSAGGALGISAATVDRWRSCGPAVRHRCQSIERRQGISAGIMLATGLTFLLVDEIRRHPEPYPATARTAAEAEAARAAADLRQARAARPIRQTSIAIGPRALHVRMLF